MLNHTLEIFARLIGRGDFHLDRKLPLSTVLAFSLKRFLDLARGVLSGLVVSRGYLVFMEAGVELINKKHIHFGKGVTLRKFVKIDGLSYDGVNIGSSVSIGPYTIIEASGTISDIGKGVSIGSNSGVGAFSFIGGAGGVTIGRNVIMGQYVSFHPEDHQFEDQNIPIRLQGLRRRGIIVEDNCWIGSKVTFLDGAHVGNGSVVAAGAVVRGKFPPCSILAGVPARVIKSR